jgi:hypothetical protein
MVVRRYFFSKKKWVQLEYAKRTGESEKKATRREAMTETLP